MRLGMNKPGSWAGLPGSSSYLEPTILEDAHPIGEYIGRERLGELPKRPKGSDCKSAGTAFGGSNPSLATAGKPVTDGVEMESKVRHVVMWHLNEPESRTETVRRMKELLESLVGVIPGLESLTVNPTGFPGEGNWDVVLISEHSSAQALADYQSHPAHQEAASWVTQQVSTRAAVDYYLDS